MNKQKLKLTAKKKNNTNKTLKHKHFVGGFKTKSKRKQTNVRTRKLRKKRQLQGGDKEPVINPEPQEEESQYVTPGEEPQYVTPGEEPQEEEPQYVTPGEEEPQEEETQYVTPEEEPQEEEPQEEEPQEEEPQEEEPQEEESQEEEPQEEEPQEEEPPEEPINTPEITTQEEPELSETNQEPFKPEDLKNGFTETIIPNNQPQINNTINVELCPTVIEVGKNINHKYMFPSQFPVITNFYKQIPENMLKNKKNI